MAYDKELAGRVREALQRESGLTEKPMFGGLAFLIGGRMAVCVSHEGGLMVRVDPADCSALLAEKHVRPMEMRGRELAGWVRVDDSGATTDAELTRWVGIGATWARSLPAK